MHTSDLSPEEAELVRKHREERQSDWKPRPLHSYGPYDKAGAFDKLHKLALSIYEEAVRSGYQDDDAKHWCYEGVMELLGPGVWDVLRKVIR